MMLFDMINHADEVTLVDFPLLLWEDKEFLDQFGICWNGLLGQLAMTAPKFVPLRC